MTDTVGMNCLSESPLHEAALLGHVDFVKEIIRQKPELAQEVRLKSLINTSHSITKGLCRHGKSTFC